MVRQSRILMVGLWVIITLLALPLVVSARQNSSELKLLDPVNGTLDASTPTASYTFSFDKGFIFSLSAWNRSGSLELEMKLLDETGTVIAEGAPLTDASTTVAVEAITVTAAATYSVELSAVKGTTGEYGLMLMPGYSYVEIWDTFEGEDDDFSLTWDESTAPTETGVADGQLRIFTDKPNTVTWLSPDEDLTWSDLYIEANVAVEGSPSYFEYGFLVRLSDDDAFYMITVTSDDSWYVSYFDGTEWGTLQDWTESPVIDTSDATPQIGLFVQGNVFTLFFNDQWVGSVEDTGKSGTEGTIALAGATTTDQTETVTVYFDNLIITSPGLTSSGAVSDTSGGDTNGSGISGLFGAGGDEKDTPEPEPTEAPQPTPTPEPVSGTGASLENWNSAQPQAIVNELLDLGFVPEGGSLEMDVKNSFGDTSSSGFSYYPLAQGRTFSNFVLGFDATLTMTGPSSGCGMHFRNNVNSRTVAYVMEDGTALLSQINGGEFHEATIYDVYPSVNTGEGATNRVLVIALNETVAMYVNGELIGGVDFNLETGSVALELFVQADDSGQTQRTYCQLQNVWLWEF